MPVKKEDTEVPTLPETTDSTRRATITKPTVTAKRSKATTNAFLDNMTDSDEQ